MRLPLARESYLYVIAYHSDTETIYIYKYD